MPEEGAVFDCPGLGQKRHQAYTVQNLSFGLLGFGSLEKRRKEIYAADGVVFEPLANRQIKSYEDNGFGGLPICMAKTHLSISHDPKLKGAPSGYILPVREVRASVGAGFIYPLIGAMRTMPGLPSKPAFLNVDLDDDGKVVGLF